ncbi:hypothetical protein Nepgr_012930 [Nepenthes gracilis]|uniref:Uncharacterized protein n=1 Tax=Nepenthes gracilis TaxID=150966 RepID=A0AAD3SI66_NEPGR|nr:hypothetical protein Nepgr_012930 [Nepenthes gracilis]
MMAMDLKGISWVGDMYQKFEDMCVEVEEAMYQDTVQYVENQVRTVGACVKKLYSDVMLDLLPASCIDSVKAENRGLCLVHYADVAIYEHPKIDIKKDPIKLETKQSTVNSSVHFHVDKQVDVEDCAVMSEDSAQGQWPEWDFDQNELAELDLGGKEKSGDECFPFVVSSLITSVENNCDKAVRSTELHSDDKATHNHMKNLGSLSASVYEGNGGISNKSGDTVSCVPSIEISSRSSNMNLVEDENQGMEMILPSRGELSSMSDGSENNGMETTMNENMRISEALDEELWWPNTGTSNCSDEVKSDGAGDKGTEASKQLYKLNLGESCVLVENYANCSISHLQGNQRSYKGKIRDAFYKRRWSRRKEQKQLALPHEGGGYSEEGKETLSPTNSGKMNSKFLDSHESDWELL